MTIPAQVKIGGHVYQVKMEDWIEDENSDGQLRDTEGILHLNKNLMRSAVECSFIHEALHAMNTTIDHVVLDSLAEQIYQFLADNNLLR